MVDAGATCDLSTVEMNPPSDGSGTYVVSGNTLIKDGQGEGSTFCVSGNTLSINATDSAVGGQTETGHLTLTKQ